MKQKNNIGIRIKRSIFYKILMAIFDNINRDYVITFDGIKEEKIAAMKTLLIEELEKEGYKVTIEERTNED